MSETELKPHDTLSCDGQASSWLSSAWTREAIIEEWDWMELDPEGFQETWYACRWTTDEERADDDKLYDLFGEFEDIDTSVYYWQVASDAPGAHLYWTVDW
jgi:hypothetical protein